MTIQKQGGKIGFLFSVFWLFSPSLAEASSAEWVPGAAGRYNWNDAANWSSSFPNGTGEEASLTNNIVGPQTNVLNQVSITVGSLNIGDTDATHRMVLTTNASGQLLTLDNGDSPAQITQVAGSLGDTLALPIAFTSGLVLRNDAGAAKNLTIQGSLTGTGNLSFVSATNNAIIFSPTENLTLPNNISGSGVIGKSGPYSLTLTGTNALILAKGSITGGGPLILSGGTFTNTAPVAGNLPFGAAGNTFRVEGGAKYYCPVGAGVSMSPGYQQCTNLVTGAGTVWDSGDNVLTLNQSYGSLVVANDALMTHVRSLGAGFNATQCSIVITNGGRIVNGPVAGGAVGIGYNSANNTVLVQGRSALSGADAMWTFCTGQRGIYIGDGYSNLTFSNSITVGSGGVITNLASIYVGSCEKAHDNFLVVTNGGRIHTGSMTCGHTTGGTRNKIWVGGVDPVTGSASLLALVSGANMIIGSGVSATNNVLWVEEGGIVSGIATLTVGNATDASSNLVTVTSSGLLGAKSAVVGNGTNNVNIIGISSQSTLECASMTVNAGIGNAITNSNGIYQFTSATPGVTNNNGAGAITLNNGVISFRRVRGADVYGNQTGSLTNITFFGNNAFRLNSATNSTTLPQSYLFTANAAPVYAGLEMYNGNTVYTNGSVTIAPSGWLSISNTVATFWGAVTNNGTMTLVDSSVTFKNGLVLGSGSTLNWTTNSSIVVNGTASLPAYATLNVSPSLQPGEVVTLLTSTEPVSGTAANWIVNLKGFRVAKINGNTQLIIHESSTGFVIVVR